MESPERIYMIRAHDDVGYPWTAASEQMVDLAKENDWEVREYMPAGDPPPALLAFVERVEETAEGYDELRVACTATADQLSREGKGGAIEQEKRAISSKAKAEMLREVAKWARESVLPRV